jgi:hypothetical protein
MGSLLSECQQGSGSRVTFGAAVPALPLGTCMHPPSTPSTASQQGRHSPPLPPLGSSTRVGKVFRPNLSAANSRSVSAWNLATATWLPAIWPASSA